MMCGPLFIISAPVRSVWTIEKDQQTAFTVSDGCTSSKALLPRGISRYGCISSDDPLIHLKIDHDGELLQKNNACIIYTSYTYMHTWMYTYVCVYIYIYIYIFVGICIWPTPRYLQSRIAEFYAGVRTVEHLDLHGLVGEFDRHRDGSKWTKPIEYHMLWGQSHEIHLKRQILGGKTSMDRYFDVQKTIKNHGFWHRLADFVEGGSLPQLQVCRGRSGPGLSQESQRAALFCRW